MLRKAVLPIIASLALAGCATYGGYGGYSGVGDPYYGRGGYVGAGYNQVGYDQYGRYGYYDRNGRFIQVPRGSVYGGYGYPGGYYGGYRYPGGYYGGYGYGGIYGGYGYPGGYYGGYRYPGSYYGYPYGSYPRPVHPRPPRPITPPGQDDGQAGERPDRNKPIWRDLRRIGEQNRPPRRMDEASGLPMQRQAPTRAQSQPLPQRPAASPMSAPRPMAQPSRSRGSLSGQVMRQAERDGRLQERQSEP